MTRQQNISSANNKRVEDDDCSGFYDSYLDRGSIPLCQILFFFKICYYSRNRMSQLGKYSIPRADSSNHQKLINNYRINYNPLLLPKLAVQGYHIKPDPACLIFISKIQLTDKTIIQKQNTFISNMKHFISVFKTEDDDLSKSVLMDFGNTASTVKTANGINFQEDKYRYEKILMSRLADLNEIILHIQRLCREPVLQKYCKTRLQTQITRISNTIRDSESRHRASHSIEEQKKLFRMSEHLCNQKRSKQKMINDIYQNRQIRKVTVDNLMGTRIIIQKKINTEPNNTDDWAEKDLTFRNSGQDDLKHSNAYKTQQTQHLQNKQPVHRQSKQRPLVRKSKQAVQKRISEVECQNKMKGVGKEDGCIQAQRSKPSNMKRSTLMPQGIYAKGRSNRRFHQKSGKSVKLKTKDENCWQQEDESEKVKLTSIANLTSIKQFSEKNDRDGSKLLLRNHRKGIREQSKRSLNSINQRQSFTPSSDEEMDEFRINQRNKKSVRFIKFVEAADGNKRQYVNRNHIYRNSSVRKQGKFRKGANSLDYTEESEKDQTGIRFVRKKTQKFDKIRREALMQDSEQIVPDSRLSNPKNKRKAKNLGSNSNLERLLRESNVQNMLGHDLQNGFFEVGRTQIPAMGLKHVTSRHSNILMEVDLSGQQIYNIHRLRQKQMGKYVKGDGFTVNSKDLVALKQNYVNVRPYQQQEVARFYGGDHLKHIDSQFIADQVGKYAFNRTFLQRYKSEQQYYNLYTFPDQDERVNDCRIEFGKVLSRNLMMNMQQKDIGNVAKSKIIS